MALRNAPAAAASKPPFEEQEPATQAKGETPPWEGETKVSNPAPAANDPAPAETPRAETPRAVALRASTAVAAPNEASRFLEEFEGMKGTADFSYGNFTVFKGNNGEIVSTDDAKTSLGRWVRITMLSWDDHWEVSPNEKAEGSRDFVAYSDDGETISRTIGEEYRRWVGKPVNDYIAFLHAEGYDQAKARMFVDIEAVILEAESTTDMNGEIVQITLSQSSLPSFNRYQERLKGIARAISRGVPGMKLPEDPFTFYLLRQLASAKGNNWTKLEVLSKLPAKI